MLQVHKKNYATVAQMMEKHREALAAALPKHLTVDRLIRLTLGELRTNTKLLDCTPASLMNSVLKAGQLGLEVGSAMGHAYLVPYKSECTLIIGYRGMLSLARRSGEIVSITARVVHQKDLFELEYGLNEKLRHVPSTEEDPGPVTHVYAVARLRDGGIQYEVMTRAEIEIIRQRSRTGQTGPWLTDWEEMARKTVVRRLFKYLPMSIEMADAMSAESEADLPSERPVAEDAIATLNARLSASVEAEPQTAAAVIERKDWPRTTADGVLVDARGIPWNPRIHSVNKTCNADGTWRSRRGADPRLIEEVERAAMASRNGGAESEPTTDRPPTEMMADYEPATDADTETFTSMGPPDEVDSDQVGDVEAEDPEDAEPAAPPSTWNMAS